MGRISAPMREVALVYTIVPSKQWAGKLSKLLLQKRLTGCVVTFPARSTYHWKGKVVNEKEYIILTKTAKRSVKKLIATVSKIHPYEVPCIIELSARANDTYVRWLERELKHP
jgi:periplasmic divalent cation tolerance protein